VNKLYIMLLTIGPGRWYCLRKTHCIH